MATVNKQSSYRNRLRRLRLLQSLYLAYPDPLGEGLLLEFAKEDPELNPGQNQVRRSLQYLHDIGFAEILSKTSPDGGELWVAKATPAGVDYLEGDDPGLPGIRHPSEFLTGGRG